MFEKLEFKIILLVGIILIIGIFAAGFMVVTIEHESLFSITETSSNTTAKIIANYVEKIMLEGRANEMKTMLEELKQASGIEEIIVLDPQARTAFSKDSPVLQNDSKVMKEIVRTKMPLVQKELEGTKRLVFYKPLENKAQCKTCHANSPAVIGAVKISVSIEKEYKKASNLILTVILATIFACCCFSIVLWLMIRKMVITPVKSLEDAALNLSRGDMSFNVDIKSKDEMGRLSKAVQDSLFSISGILRRIKELSIRISRVAEDVEIESKKVVDGTILETEAINNISTSIEQMNAAITEIADGTDGLAASAEQTAASMDEMVTSTAHITKSTQELSVAIETTSVSIEQLSATIKEVANNANELTAAAEETQSAIIEISSSIKEVERNAKESSILSDKVKNDAVAFGMTSIEKTIHGMSNIKSSVEKTADYITKLGGRSEEIGKILNVIDDITDQTTLLALNAAILAAQAGEHGKGFSVVADEIKDLAERTTKSTQEIGDLIKSVQQEVNDAVNAMDEGLKSVEIGSKFASESADALRKIVESSKKSSDMTTSIERSTTEQSKSANFVSEAMEKVLNMVGQIAKATTEQNKGIQLIMQASEKMSDFSKQVRTATSEQSLNSKQISQAIELVSDKSQQISRAINEQKIGSSHMWNSIEKIKNIPKQNKELSFKVNQLLKVLHKDAELTVIEMGNFKFIEDTAADVLRMGIIPLESPAEMFKKFSPLADYLSQKLNKRVDLKVGVDFQGAITDIGESVTQFCFMTPSTYIEAHKKYGIEVLVLALRDGKPFQHSVIVAKSDSKINSVEDIRGHSFAFGDPHSTSSHIAPRGMLLEAGIDIKDLSYFNYLGHHDDVAKAVLNGDFDAGGIMESTAYKFKDKGLKFIKFSEDIPEFNICVAKDLDKKVVALLKNIFISMSDSVPEQAAILRSISANYTGFAETSDEKYNGVRLMMSKIGLI